MKKIALIVLSLILFYSCEEEGKSKRVVSASSGNINSLSVVIDNDLWEGEIGESIRNTIGAPLYGLPQDEPQFSLKQMPTVVFTDFATKNRTILKVVKGKDADTKFFENAYAKPQKMAVVYGQTNQEIIDQINTNAAKIISAFKTEEIKEKQRRIRKSLNKNNNIEDVLGLTIQFPSAYRVAKEDGKFFWLRRDIKTGTINLMLYEMPLDAISKGDETINDIIKIRDSIGQAHIPGPLDGSYMITEDAYTPFIGSSILDNKPTYVTRSVWEVKKAFMSGPFINYAIEDKINNRYIIAEGFVFAPSVEKRDYVFELESIIKSLKIK
ncbi:DUF4837 family protein [Pontimicrobium sp. IMCC45349]|uniref:DUF4837 family protein n=1 Tax=Pontimicrobium sp. IMCC45349 TaxID=3391574 RepID=UPI0039A14EF2